MAPFTAEIKRLEVGLNRTLKEIKIFEGKFRVTSEVFLKDFTAEDLQGGDDEYVKWTGELKIRDSILEELKQVRPSWLTFPKAKTTVHGSFYGLLNLRLQRKQ